MTFAPTLLLSGLEHTMAWIGIMTELWQNRGYTLSASSVAHNTPAGRVDVLNVVPGTV